MNTSASTKAPERTERTAPRRMHKLTYAAAAWGTSVDFARKAALSGRVKYVRIGKRIMISSDEIARVQNEGI